MSDKVKVRNLRSSGRTDLLNQLSDLKDELKSLVTSKQTAANSAKVLQIRNVRKSIARVLTVLTQTQRAHLKTFYAGKKHQPLDLRVKKTRAIRRRLTKNEAKAKTEKQVKKLTHFRKRRYALKA